MIVGKPDMHVDAIQSRKACSPRRRLPNSLSELLRRFDGISRNTLAASVVCLFDVGLYFLQAEDTGPKQVQHSPTSDAIDLSHLQAIHDGVAYSEEAKLSCVALQATCARGYLASKIRVFVHRRC